MTSRRPLVSILLAAFWSATTFAQPSIKPPIIGAIRDSNGSIQTVMGVPGSFVLADTGVANAVNAAFSTKAGLIKTDTELLVLNEANEVAARFDAPPGPALFAFEQNGNPALAYYGNALYVLQDGALKTVNWSGAALSIASSGSQSAYILVRRGRQLWRVCISVPSGEVQSETALPDALLPALLLADGSVLFERRHELVLRDASGVERTAAIDFQPQSFSPMSNNWIAIHESGGRPFALRITPDALTVYQLPEVTQ